MQIHCIGRLCQPVPILAELDDLHRREKLDSIRRWISQRFQQPGRNQNWNIMRLTIQDPGNLLNCEPSRQLPEQHQKPMLIIPHKRRSKWILCGDCGRRRSALLRSQDTLHNFLRGHPSGGIIAYAVD